MAYRSREGYLSNSPHTMLVFDCCWVVSCVTTSDSNCFMTFSCPSKLVKSRWEVRAPTHTHLVSKVRFAPDFVGGALSPGAESINNESVLTWVMPELKPASVGGWLGVGDPLS